VEIFLAMMVAFFGTVAYVQRLRISDLELQIEIRRRPRRTAINKFERAWRETEKEEEPDEKS
jgi:hypothetical protein